MQLLFDFFPIIAFFIAYKFSDIYTATIVIIVAASVQILIHWIRTRGINKMHVVSAVLVTLFGGITLYLKDPVYLKWKPTILYWLFAATFLASQFFGKKMIIQRMLDHAFELPLHAWRTLNLMWVSFFTVMAFANLYVAYNFSEKTWVDFKLFGFLGATFLFALAQGFWLSKHIQEPAEHSEANPEKPED